MKSDQTEPEGETSPASSSRRRFFTALTAGAALAATAQSSPLTGGPGTVKLKSRLMSRIHDELKNADESELHSYDRNDTSHAKYVKA